ncbi:MAG: hypothetical protein ACI6PN_09695, partial [Polaribacter sp.]|uniref:hypothetical protein n=1 Tax=Polaribacter sp. TaxID=1920175 RepID=UPI00384D6C5D
MKKITLLAILMVAFITNAQIVLTEDFEGGIPTTWSNTNAGVDASGIFTINNTGDAVGFGAGNGYLYSDTNAAGNYAEFNSLVNGNNGDVYDISLISPAMDLSTYTNIKLSFDSWLTGGYGEVVTVEASADGGTTWTVIETMGLDANGNNYGTKLYDISSVVAGSAAAHIKLKWTGESSWGWSFDNIVVQQPEGSAPNVAENLAPADGATDVAIAASNMAVAISWDAPSTGDAATGYEIHWGSVSGALSVLGTTASTAINITGISYNTTFYWKIVPINTAGAAAGAVEMSFTTMEDPALATDKNAIEGFK